MRPFRHFLVFTFIFLSTTVFFSCTHLTTYSTRLPTNLTCESLFTNDIKSNSNTTSGLTLNDVQKVLDKKRFQEASWVLRRIGEKSRAEALENRIEHELTHAPIISFEAFKPSTDSISEIYIVTFASGLRGLFKPAAKFWKEKKQHNAPIANPYSEVMAYQFARTIEMIDVPVTVLREIEGMTGSLQAFVDLSLSFDDGGNFEPVLRKQKDTLVFNPNITQGKIINLFDYMILNYDREGKNMHSWGIATAIIPYMKPGEGGGVAAYDHGAAFQAPIRAKGNFPPTHPRDLFLGQINNYRFFLENLQTKLSDVKINQLMAGTFSEEIIAEVQKRRRVLIEHLSEKMAKSNL